MAIPALRLQRLTRREGILRTVAQGTDTRNLMIALGLVASCVITGETISGVIEAGTQAITAVVILILVRIVAASQGGASVPTRCMASTAGSLETGRCTTLVAAREPRAALGGH
ncbi:hypothetical protein ACH4GK_20875 [Streptomyces rimosus]|uniref:hypothetical protein n=1 Tax=Streptomyces rimosus TaxID=1927 RepID=UPI0004CAA976|nr:hypothetical protein [Streptomyces rimosus]